MKDNVIVKNIVKKYDDFTLDQISFNIPKGSIVGLIGENGAGKTTTIKAILNLIKLDSGEVEIFNQDYLRHEIDIKENIGVVLDNSFLPSYYTIPDIKKVMQVMHKNWNNQLFDKYIEEFKLPRKVKCKDYSKGMFIKLKIACALAYEPKLLILDEPTSGLDPIARSDMLDVFARYVQDTNNSILISSHITADLERIADRVLFLNNGKLILDKSRDELINDYKIIKCQEDEFKRIDKNDYLRYKKERFEYLVLTNNNIDFDKYHFNNITIPTLEDIMLLYIRGER